MTRLPVMCAVNSPPKPRKLMTSSAPAVMPNTAGSKNLAGQLAPFFIELVRSRFYASDFDTCAGCYCPDDAWVKVTRFLFACLSYCAFAAYRLTRPSVHRAPCILACDSRQPESRIDLARSFPANEALRALNGGVDVSHLRSSSSVRFTCRAGNGTNAAVANIEDR